MAEKENTDRLLEEFSLEDSSFQPEVDALPSKPAEAPTPRNDKGQFVAAPKAQPHPASLVARAVKFGLTTQQIEQTSSDELRELIDDARFERLAAARAPEPSRAPEPAPQPIAEEKLDLLLDDQILSEEVIGNFKKLQEYIDKKFSAYDQRLKQTHGIAEALANQSVDQRLDRLFRSDKAFFGDETSETVKKDTLTGQRRLNAVALMKQMESGTIEERYAKVREILNLGAQAAPSAPAPEAKPSTNGHNGRITAEEWDDAATPRPTQRSSPILPKGEKRAALAVAAKMRERGINEDSFGEVEEHNLPD